MTGCVGGVTHFYRRRARLILTMAVLRLKSVAKRADWQYTFGRPDVAGWIRGLLEGGQDQAHTQSGGGVRQQLCTLRDRVTCLSLTLEIIIRRLLETPDPN